MDKQRLQELAGIQLNEALNPTQEFFPRSIGFNRKAIMSEVNDARADDGEEALPIEAFTDVVCQKYADLMMDALYDTAGERMADAHIDVIDTIAKLASKNKK